MPILFDSVKRINKFPIDPSSLYDNLEAAQNYVSNPLSVAYAGQVIYIKKLGFYGITEDDQGNLSLSSLNTLDDTNKTEMQKFMHDEIVNVLEHPEDGGEDEVNQAVAERIKSHIIYTLHSETGHEVVKQEVVSTLQSDEVCVDGGCLDDMEDIVSG